MMKNSFKVLIASALATAGLLGAISEAKAGSSAFTPRKIIKSQETKIVFTCEQQGNQFATVPQLIRERVWKYPRMVNTLVERQVVQEYSPAFVWTATLASDHPLGAYTPSGRCNAVSARLTNLATSLGIPSLMEMSDAGIVNHERVIFASERPVASRNNVVFTLKPSNRPNAWRILKQFQVGISGGIGGPDLPRGVSPTIYE